VEFGGGRRLRSAFVQTSQQTVSQKTPLRLRGFGSSQRLVAVGKRPNLTILIPVETPAGSDDASPEVDERPTLRPAVFPNLPQLDGRIEKQAPDVSTFLSKRFSRA